MGLELQSSRQRVVSLRQLAALERLSLESTLSGLGPGPKPASFKRVILDYLNITFLVKSYIRCAIYNLMKKADLHPKLQLGAEKGSGDLQNLWFVIPPPPSREKVAGAKLNSKLLREAHQVLASLPRFDDLNGVDQLILALLVRREALHSSRIEGTASTIEQVLTPRELFRKGEKSARASIVGYAQALEDALVDARKRGPKIFTKDLLRKLHKDLMSRDPEFRGKPGLFRNEIGKGIYVTVGGLNRPENSTFNPTPPKHIPRTLDENLEWMRDDLLIEMSHAGMAPGLIVRMARGHAHFEAIHPFSDGNGRVGRILMALQMVCEGFTPLYLSGYIEAHKPKYYKALQASQMKLNEIPIIHFIAQAVVSSFDEAQKTKKALGALPATWQERGGFRSDSAAKASLSLLLDTPILTVKRLQGMVKVSQPAAKRAIEQLQAAKILRERTGLGRNRVFAAEEVIEILARPFGEDIQTALERAESLY